MQYTQDQTRGPSAGGSGQDNVYQFDGVNVTLPLFGTLSAEPASHDIAQVTMIKGGARAVDFDRAGGFTIDSVSKSGTNSYAGQVSYQFQTDSMAAELTNGSASRYRPGPRAGRRSTAAGRSCRTSVFFYGSYYRPDERARTTAPTSTAPLPNYDSTRNEGFGKADVHADAFGADQRQLPRVAPPGHGLTDFAVQRRGDDRDAAASVAMKIGTADASWVINSRELPDVQVHALREHEPRRPDNVVDGLDRHGVGTRLDLNNLDTLGLFTVPMPDRRPDRLQRVRAAARSTGTATSSNGVQTGGGIVGYGSTQFDNDDFFRDGGQVGYNLTLGSTIRHDLHAGYQRYIDSEDLTAQLERLGHDHRSGRPPQLPGHADLLPGGVPARRPSNRCRRSTPSTESQNIEVNDTIRWKNWTSTRACSRATTSCSARVCERIRRRCPATCCRRGDASTRCTRSRSAR